ncbi:MAG: flagellar biosynthetic protein FliO [Rubrivivax sp.]|nr:flagellar biosynthetic protein FliO [Rubrivivax sp.]MDP3610519.1 flagellar biosynthetic protein FliO [Rubrivivax sp.]
MQQGLTSLLWFLAIIACIPVVLWLMKRSPLVGGGAARPGCPKPVAVLPLSTQQKLVTVEVGQGADRLWLVLGVSPQGIRTLHTMVPLADTPEGPPPPPAAAFAQLLDRLRGKDGNGASL